VWGTRRITESRGNGLILNDIYVRAGKNALSETTARTDSRADNDVDPEDQVARIGCNGGWGCT
jgi:hypothetical protein